MSDLRDTVVQRVRETARRLRVQKSWETAWTGASWGFGALLALVGTHKVLPLPRELLFLGAALPGLGAGCGFVLGGFRPVAPAVAARWLDARLGLQERLATALEIAPGNPGGDWQHLVIGDAAARCRDVEPRRLIPLRLPRVARWTAALALTLGAVLLVPEYRSPSRLQAQQEAETVRSTGRQLSQLMRRTLEEPRNLSDPIRQELGQLETLGDRLQQASLTRSDALKEVSRATETLREQGLDLARNPTLRRLEKAARGRSSGTEGPRPGVQESNQDRAARAGGCGPREGCCGRHRPGWCDAVAQAAAAGQAGRPGRLRALQPGRAEPAAAPPPPVDPWRGLGHRSGPRRRLGRETGWKVRGSSASHTGC